MGYQNSDIALIFSRLLGNRAAETPVKFQSDVTIASLNIPPWDLHEILR